MHIANKRRFGAFLVLVLAVVLAVTGAWYFRALPLMELLSRDVDIEQIRRIELTGVLETGEPEFVALTDPTDIRAVIGVLDGARVKRRLWPDRAREIVPGLSFLLRVSDASGREIVLDVAGRGIIYNLNYGYDLVSPDDLSELDGIVKSRAA